MNSDKLIVAGAVIAAGIWLGRRVWNRLRNRYNKSSCCGSGCGCAAPVVFGSKKKKPGLKK